MEFVDGLPFQEAVQKLGARSPIGSILNSYDWRTVPVGLRERAFFSATIENVRFLDRAQNFLDDFLTGARGTNDAGQTFLKAGGRAQFIEDLQKFAIREGMRPLDPALRGTLKDIGSASRLGLIYDTNLKSAQDYGHWKQGQDPDVLDSFPSQRFIRVVAVAKPRPLHEANRGEERRKDDLPFWLAMNSPDIGGFGVTWGPWGFNSGMDVQQIGRTESDRLGLTTPKKRVVSDQKPEIRTETPKAGSGIRRADIDFNATLKASTENLDKRLINFLKLAFGDQAEFVGDAVRWKGSE